MKNISILLIILILFLSACKRTKDYSPEFELDLREMEVNYFEELDQPIDEIVKFEQPYESYLSNINKTLKHEDYYYVLNEAAENKVFRYDLEGNFDMIIGGIGKGPGEYTSAYDFTIDRKKNNFYILNNGWSINKYDVNGVFEKEHNLSFATYSFEIDNNLNLYKYTSYNNGFDKHRLFITNTLNNDNGTIIEKYLDDKTTLVPVIEKNFNKTGDEIFFWESFSNTIQRFYNSDLLPYIKLNFGEKSFLPEYFNKEVNEIIKMENQGEFYTLRQFLNGNNKSYVCFASALDYYHMVLDKESSEFEIYYSDHDSGFLPASIINANDFPGFFVLGEHLVDLKQKNPDFFHKNLITDFDKDSMYLVFLEL